MGQPGAEVVVVVADRRCVHRTSSHSMLNAGWAHRTGQFVTASSFDDVLISGQSFVASEASVRNRPVFEVEPETAFLVRLLENQNLRL